MAKFNFQLIRFRLPAAFGLAGAVVLIVSIVSVMALSSSSNSLKTVANETLPMLSRSAELARNAQVLTSETENLAVVRTEESRVDHQTYITDMLVNIREDKKKKGGS